MIKDVRILGYRTFTSKAQKQLHLCSWAEAYSETEGIGAAGYTSFVPDSQAAAFRNAVGKTVKAYVSHQKGYHSIDLIGD